MKLHQTLAHVVGTLFGATTALAACHTGVKGHARDELPPDRTYLEQRDGGSCGFLLRAEPDQCVAAVGTQVVRRSGGVTTSDSITVIQCPGQAQICSVIVDCRCRFTAR